MNEQFNVEAQEFHDLVSVLKEEELIRIEYRLRKRGLGQLADKIVVERVLREKTKDGQL